MNKAKLVERMAKLSNLPKATCKECLESFIVAVSESLKDAESVVLTGFGTFKLIDRKERIGVNPTNGKPMTIGPKRVAKFTASKALKELTQ